MDILLTPNECEKFVQITLPDVKDKEKTQHFLCDEENLVLYEITKYSDPHRSWFIDNLFCKDGHLVTLTKVDPLFIFLPQLENYTEKQFRTLQDICSTFNSSNEASSRLEYALSPDIDWSSVCDKNEIDGESEPFVRFNLEKTLSWLLKKHSRTMEALKSQFDDNTSKATLISYAQDLIDQYLTPTLSTKFRERVSTVMRQSGDEDIKLKPIQSTSKRHSEQPKQPTKAKPIPPKPAPFGGIARFFTKKK